MVPSTVPLKFRSPVVPPLQIAAFSGTLTVGVGFIVSVNICDEPGQPFADGDTVIFAVTGDVPLLVTVNDGILLPVPVKARPIVLLSFVHV